MGYRKSFKAGPFRVTASKSGVSYSMGVKGARVTRRADGRVQTTVSVPGTGVRYTKTVAPAKKTPTRGAGRSGPARTRQQSSPPSAAGTLPAIRSQAAAPTRLPGRLTSVPAAGHGQPAGPMVFSGYLGAIALYPDRIEISRSRAGRLNGNRPAVIYWHQVVGIDFRDPGLLINGHVHFATAGDPRGLTQIGRGNRMAAAARNPHAVMFAFHQRRAYRRLRSMLTPVSPALTGTL